MGNGFRVGRGACSMLITQAHSTNITSEGWSGNMVTLDKALYVHLSNVSDYATNK